MNLAIISLHLIIAGAFLDTIVFNKYGLNLRLGTVSMLGYLVYHLKSNHLKEKFILLVNSKSILIFGLLYLSFTISTIFSDFKFIALKQQILYILLFLNVIYFSSVKIHLRYFRLHFVLSIVLCSAVVNVYSIVKPILEFINGRISLLRPSGFFEQSNTFGSLNVLMYTIFISLILDPFSKKWERTLSIVSICLLTPIFIVASNRGSILALFIVIPILLVLMSKTKYYEIVKKNTIRFIILLGFAVSIGLLIAKNIPGMYGTKSQLDVIVARISFLFDKQNKDPSLLLRLKQKEVAVQKIYQSPIFGSGLGNSATAVTPEIQDVLANSNNIQSDFKQSTELIHYDILGDLGLVGALLFVIFFGYILILSVENIKVFVNTSLHSLSVAVFCSYLGLIINGISSAPFTLHFFWLNIGLIYFLRFSGTSISEESNKSGFI